MLHCLWIKRQQCYILAFLRVKYIMTQHGSTYLKLTAIMRHISSYKGYAAIQSDKSGIAE